MRNRPHSSGGLVRTLPEPPERVEARRLVQAWVDKGQEWWAPGRLEQLEAAIEAALKGKNADGEKAGPIR